MIPKIRHAITCPRRDGITVANLDNLIHYSQQDFIEGTCLRKGVAGDRGKFLGKIRWSTVDKSQESDYGSLVTGRADLADRHYAWLSVPVSGARRIVHSTNYRTRLIS